MKSESQHSLVFSWQLIPPPPPISNPLAFFEPRMPGEQSASTDNQYLPSLFWGARAREMHVAKKKKKKDAIRDPVLKKIKKQDTNKQETPTEKLRMCHSGSSSDPSGREGGKSMSL